MRKDEVFSQIGFKDIWRNLTFLMDVILFYLKNKTNKKKANVENNVCSSDIWFAINATQQWLSF